MAEEASQPSEEELRAQLEDEIRKVKVEDLILQSAVSILNLAARRLAKDDERDLGQAKRGIDAARGLTELATEEARAQLRDAVSQVQVLYAKHAGEGGEGEPSAEEKGRGEPAESGTEEPAASEAPSRSRPKQGSRLWTPPGSGSG